MGGMQAGATQFVTRVATGGTDICHSVGQSGSLDRGPQVNAQLGAQSIPAVAAPPINVAVALAVNSNTSNGADSNVSIGFLAAQARQIAQTNTTPQVGTSGAIASALAVASRFDTIFFLK